MKYLIGLTLCLLLCLPVSAQTADDATALLTGGLVTLNTGSGSSGALWTDQIDGTGSGNSLTAGTLKGTEILDIFTDVRKKVISPISSSNYQTTTYYFGDGTTVAAVNTVIWDATRSYQRSKSVAYSATFTAMLSSITGVLLLSSIIDPTTSETFAKLKGAQLAYRFGVATRTGNGAYDYYAQNGTTRKLSVVTSESNAGVKTITPTLY